MYVVISTSDPCRDKKIDRSKDLFLEQRLAEGKIGPEDYQTI